jgi:hypothetical protein
MGGHGGILINLGVGGEEQPSTVELASAISNTFVEYYHAGEKKDSYLHKLLY